jgi:predicted acetyltransferase
MLLDCYHRVAQRTHGMMPKSDRELKRLFQNPQHRVVGYEDKGQIEGYLIFTFQPAGSFITNDLQVQEFIYENHQALSQLLTFLHSQADQVRLVILNTLDEYLHHLLLDPRNDSERLIPDVYHETNAQGVGLMYRIVDVPGMFDRLVQRDFGGQTCRIKLTITDGFLPENAGSTLLSLQNGHLTRPAGGSFDVVAQLDIADFSSLLAGTVNFTSLFDYGLTQVSDASYAQVLSRAFAVDQKPVCFTQF